MTENETTPSNQGGEVTPAVEQAEPSAPAIDTTEIKNLKSEMNRKMTNLEATTAQLLAQLQSMQAPKVDVASDEDIQKLWFDNPGKAAEMIEARVLGRLQKANEVTTKQAEKKNQVLAQLGAEFPELNDGSHALTQKAMEIYGALPADEQASPAALRAAVSAAALETGIKPKSKRTSNDSGDSYMPSGKKGSAPKESAEAKATTEAQAWVAEQFGVKLTNEVKERVAKKHGRKTYTSWN